MENESKYGQLSQKVRQLRGELNDVDDLVEQAEEYLQELNQKYDFELEKSKSTNNGKSTEKSRGNNSRKNNSRSSLNSSKASKSSSRNQV